MKKYDFEKTFRSIKRDVDFSYGYSYRHALQALQEGNTELYGHYLNKLLTLIDFAGDIGYDTKILLHASCNIERFVK